MTFLAVFLLLAIAPAASGQYATSIDADPEGNIKIVAEDGKNIGYQTGDKVVYFSEFEKFPKQWSDYSDATLRAMNYGFSMGAMGSGGSSSGGNSAINGIPGFEGKSWDDIEKMAAGGTVTWWMWKGAPHINAWVEGWLAPRMTKQYGITLVVPEDKGAPGAVVQVATEMAAEAGGKRCQAYSPAPCDGSIDLIWINKENFRKMKQADNLFGPWAPFVPSAANFDFFSPSIAFDGGVATQGYEMPYNSAQVVFHYNSAQVPSPPASFGALVTWIKANPGKFVYSASADFTGMAFIQHAFYYFAGAALGDGKSWQDFLGAYNAALYAERAPAVWAALNELEAYLYSAGGEFEYPATHEPIRDLFADGTVWLDLAYDPNHAATNMISGKYQNSTKGYVFDDGTIANTNFVAIPANSPNKAAAMVVGNAIGSMEAIFTRAQPERWGALPALDANNPKIVASGWDAAFDYILTHHATPSVEDLAEARLAELNAQYIDAMKKDWKDCVQDKVGGAKCGSA